MPIIKSAQKKVRQTKVKTQVNKKIEASFETLIRKIRQGGKTSKLYDQLQSKIDRAVKKKLIHKNKASRLKSRLSKLKSKAAAK
jgi:small subunit ribosomal protein S20